MSQCFLLYGIKTIVGLYHRYHIDDPTIKTEKFHI